MEQKQFDRILEKYKAGKASPEEVAFLEAYYKAFGLRPELQENPEQFWLGMKANIDAKIDGHQPIQHPPEIRKLRLWPHIAVAASILLCCSIGFYFYKQKANSDQIQLAQHQIKPGSNMAILTLANGKRIVLNTAANGTLVAQTGLKITKTADGQLVYSVTDDGNADTEYNTVETPKGGQYRVELADGTIAWLNAASSLKYPNHFNGNERIVELNGEAYFEVAKDKTHPFIVKSSRQSVEVLGTHFNINTYDDETTVKSTLLEGSVKVTENSTGKSELLKPGQQAQLSASRLKVVEANTEEAIAWKNGYFKFNDEKIESIMRKIARWYDIKVEYKGEITDEGFNGAITRFGDINDVLNIMQRSKAVHFKIEGRRIIVEK